tara:strand:- start:209 stop:535 length:327 start_codon:yes stop_codon:yes gene_type:complete
MKCRHHWKKLKRESVVLIDTIEKQAAKYHTYECTQCQKIEERIDRRTTTIIGEKYKLKANQRYLIGNKGSFSPYLVPEDSLFVIKPVEPKKEDEVEIEEIKNNNLKVL